MVVQYINLILAIALFIISIGTYFFSLGKTSHRHPFWAILASAAVVFTISQTLVVTGLQLEWYFHYERMVGYILLIAAIVCLLVEYKLERPKSAEPKPADDKPAG